MVGDEGVGEVGMPGEGVRITLDPQPKVRRFRTFVLWTVRDFRRLVRASGVRASTLTPKPKSAAAGSELVDLEEVGSEEFVVGFDVEVAKGSSGSSLMGAGGISVIGVDSEAGSLLRVRFDDVRECCRIVEVLRRWVGVLSPDDILGLEGFSSTFFFLFFFFIPFAVTT